MLSASTPLPILLWWIAGYPCPWSLQSVSFHSQNILLEETLWFSLAFHLKFIGFLALQDRVHIPYLWHWALSSDLVQWCLSVCQGILFLGECQGGNDWGVFHHVGHYSLHPSHLQSSHVGWGIVVWGRWWGLFGRMHFHWFRSGSTLGHRGWVDVCLGCSSGRTTWTYNHLWHFLFVWWRHLCH